MLFSNQYSSEITEETFISKSLIWIIYFQGLSQKLTCLNESFPPIGYTFRKNDGHVIFYMLEENEMSIPKVTDCIKIDSELHVQHFIKEGFVLLPQWFHQGKNFWLSCKSILENIPTYLQSPKELALFLCIWRIAQTWILKGKFFQQILYGPHYYLDIHQYSHTKCYWKTTPYHLCQN